jgi:hypothetical protein
MKQKISLIQKLAWFYAVGFLFVVIISHWPGLTDAQGRLMGLFKIDPIDDIFHLLSGLYAVFAAWKSDRASVIFFMIVGIPYGLDAITGMLFGREFLNLNIFTKGLGSPDFSLNNFLINLPHIGITLFAIWVGFFLGRQKNKQSSTITA